MSVTMSATIQVSLGHHRATNAGYSDELPGQGVCGLIPSEATCWCVNRGGLPVLCRGGLCAHTQAMGGESTVGGGSSDRTYVGTGVLRREDVRLLTGRGRFVGGVRLPGMLHAVVVRSPIAHGRLVRCDVDA